MGDLHAKFSNGKQGNIAGPLGLGTRNKKEVYGLNGEINNQLVTHGFNTTSTVVDVRKSR